MRIAINTRFLLKSKMEGFGWFTYEVVKRLVEQHSEHTFILFFDRPYDPKFVFGSNVVPVVLNPPARHPILFIYWFEVAVRRALKKYQADVFLSPDGYLSLGSKIPQIAVMHDLNFEHYPEDLPFSARAYYRFFFPKFARKASHIVTVSEFSKRDLVAQYGIDPSKITVSYNGCSPVFRVISEEEKFSVRSKYTGGKPYLIFVGALHPRKNVSRLLAAYNLLKVQGKIDADLVIVGESMWSQLRPEDLGIGQDVLADIHFTGHLSLDELSQVVASATLFVFVPYFEGFGIPMLEAMQCGVPVVSGNLSSLPEVGGSAVLYCDPFQVEDIAGQIFLALNDDQLRREMIAKGLEQAKLFSWDDSARKIYGVIEALAF